MEIVLYRIHLHTLISKIRYIDYRYQTTFTLPTAVSRYIFQDHSGWANSHEARNCEAIEPAGVRGHALPSTQTGSAVVLSHLLPDAVRAVVVHTATRVDGLHAFVSTAVVATFMRAEAFRINTAGIVT